MKSANNNDVPGRKRRKTGWRRLPSLEIINNRAVIKLLKKFAKRPGLPFSDARHPPRRGILRSVARKYIWASDRDEYDLLRTCLRKKVEALFEPV